MSLTDRLTGAASGSGTAGAMRAGRRVVGSAAIKRLGAGALRFPVGAPPWPAGVARDDPERRTGTDYDHAWSRRYPVRLARAMVLDNLARPMARAVAPTDVRGREHLRFVDRPIVFAANHASHLDTPLLLTTLPLDIRHRTAVAAASDYFFDRTWKAALWSFALAAVPIERTKVSRSSADTAAELLEDDWNLVIFPEGGRSPDGWGQPFRGGAAYLSRRTGRPVVPVHIQGTRDVLGKRPEVAGRPPGGSGTESRRSGRLQRAPVTVSFGTPLFPAEGEDARRLAQRIEEAVAVLGAENDSDWWTARRRAARHDLPDRRGPESSPWRRAWALGPSPTDEAVGQRDEAGSEQPGGRSSGRRAPRRGSRRGARPARRRGERAWPSRA